MAHLADDLGLGAEDVLVLQHIVAELVGNAVRHAYYGDAEHGHADQDHGSRIGRSVRVQIAPRSDGALEVVVSDRGRWRRGGPAEDPTAAHRGLALVASLSEDLTVRSGADAPGTQVRAILRPRHRITIGTGKPGPPWPEGQGPMPRARTEPEAQPAIGPDAFSTWLIPGARECAEEGIGVAGPIDQITGRSLERQIHAVLARPSNRAMLLDLTAATLITSGGVRVLGSALRRHGSRLRILAREGSAAHLVLDRVNLPWTKLPREPPP